MKENRPPSGEKSHVSQTPGVLERILHEAQRCKDQTQSFLAVFDLDSTLFDLTVRVASIVESFASDPDNRKKFPKECSSLADIQIAKSDWGLGESLERLGINSSTHPDFCFELHEHWAKWFFSDHYLHHDEPLAGAVGFVKALQDLNADIMYLTGRDAPRMKKGTEQSLIDSGFPLQPPKASLVLKPSANLDDAAFKVTVLKDAQRKFDRIWLFENEPVNLNLVARQCPEIGLVFIESTHSGREEVADTLDRIQHFEVDLAEFANFKE